MDFELSKYQQDIVDYVKYNKSNLLIDAKAGSGKTSTLILIADELLKSGQKCLFLSFNKSIVDELKLKIPAMSSNIKTVHSLGLSFIRSYLYKKHNTNYEIIDMDIGKKKVRELCKSYYDKYFMNTITDYCKETMSEQEIKEVHTNNVTDFVSICNFIRLYCGDYSDQKTIEYITNRFCKTLPVYIDEVLPNYYELVPAVINKILNMFEYPEQNTEGKYQYAIDFLDMIFLPVYYNMSVPYSLKDSLDTILIDESQDLSQLQQMFVRRLSTGFNRFIFVGDRNQCQPAGTKILMADLTEKNIEDIKVGDMVVSYDTEAGYFRQQTIRCKGNKVLETKRLKADGYYNVVLDNGKSSNYTYNHKCYAKINTDEGYITYIMGTNDGKYRIGHTKLFNNNSKVNGFGLRIRMRQEKCKYGWVLNYHKDKESAYMEEQLLSYKYQIPQCIFTDGITHKIPRNSIEWFYNNFGYDNIKNNVIKCLKDYGRSIDYPFVTVGDYKRHITRKGISVYETCNLIPEIMEFMYFDENNKKRHYRNKCNVVGASYSKIKSITYKQDECYVYCLKIDKLENYVADKILTHNCIYGFNGADTKAIDRIKSNFVPKELPLSICYRCPEKIVRLAQDNVPSIEWNKDRLDKGTLETITYSQMKKNIGPGNMIIGRKNRDLLTIYKDFTLNDKREVKFKNKDMVTAIQRDITQCIRDYMLNYAKNLNIDRVVYEYMDKFAATNNISKNSTLYKAELNNFIKTYAKEHKDELSSKQIMKSHQTLDYLDKCMTEYKLDGAYQYEEDNILTSYFDIIIDFIEEYKKTHSSILVADFVSYMEDFLNASLTKYNVPIISSVHSMKGGEADTVYIYDYPRFPYYWSGQTSEDEQQEKNLQYVAITRAKKNLYLILQDPVKAKSPEQAERIEENNDNCVARVDEINNLVDNLNASKYNQ